MSSHDFPISWGGKATEHVINTYKVTMIKKLKCDSIQSNRKSYADNSKRGSTEKFKCHRIQFNWKVYSMLITQKGWLSKNLNQTVFRLTERFTVNQLNFAARKFRGLIIIANLGIFCAIKFHVLVLQDPFLTKPFFTKMPVTSLIMVRFSKFNFSLKPDSKPHKIICAI